jgi:hypothetical protein
MAEPFAVALHAVRRLGAPAGEPVLVITLLGHQDHVPPAWTSPMAAAVRRAAAPYSVERVASSPSSDGIGPARWLDCKDLSCACASARARSE